MLVIPHAEKSSVNCGGGVGEKVLKRKTKVFAGCSRLMVIWIALLGKTGAAPSAQL